MPKDFLEIPEQLQFTEKPVLIAALGGSLGVFYLMSEKAIRKVSEIEEKFPEYSDREGHFERRGKGETYGSGSVYEINDDELKERFAKKAAAEITKILRIEKPEQIFIIKPAYMKNMVAKRLGKRAAAITRFIDGNYAKKSPLDAIKKIIRSK